jgi:hypothetical protein
MHLRAPLSPMVGILPKLRSFGLSFNSTGADWDITPDETRAASDRVFRIESAKEVELGFVFGFPGGIAGVVGKVGVPGAVERGFVYLRGDTRSRIQSETLERDRVGVSVSGMSLGVIKILTKTLPNSADAPPILHKLALMPTFEEGFGEAVVELITACALRVAPHELCLVAIDMFP